MIPTRKELLALAEHVLDMNDDCPRCIAAGAALRQIAEAMETRVADQPTQEQRERYIAALTWALQFVGAADHESALLDLRDWLRRQG